ncbi:hypothetical protein V1477_018921 [Vespula maculifrons]|uniref:Uncharacterized protein n=1 Tax=Vespula maculifrons TaxID=7453 RepID=A0ABD2AST6_VESMC
MPTKWYYTLLSILQIVMNYRSCSCTRQFKYSVTTKCKLLTSSYNLLYLKKSVLCKIKVVSAVMEMVLTLCSLQFLF